MAASVVSWSSQRRIGASSARPALEVHGHHQLLFPGADAHVQVLPRGAGLLVGEALDVSAAGVELGSGRALRRARPAAPERAAVDEHVPFELEAGEPLTAVQALPGQVAELGDDAGLEVDDADAR